MSGSPLPAGYQCMNPVVLPGFTPYSAPYQACPANTYCAPDGSGYYCLPISTETYTEDIPAGSQCMLDMGSPFPPFTPCPKGMTCVSNPSGKGYECMIETYTNNVPPPSAAMMMPSKPMPCTSNKKGSCQPNYICDTTKGYCVPMAAVKKAGKAMIPSNLAYTSNH